MKKQQKRNQTSALAESLGWIGTVALLGSYTLLSLDIVRGDSLIYHSMMLIGAIGLAVITYYHRTFQPFIVNVVFAILACIAIFRILFLA